MYSKKLILSLLEKAIKKTDNEYFTNIDTTEYLKTSFIDALDYIDILKSDENSSQDIYNQKIYQILTHPRSIKALQTAGIKTIRELIIKTPYEIGRLPDFGKKCLEHTMKDLSKHNLYLGMKL